jgi:hypothetical protein
MKTQTLDLNKMGLETMTNLEMQGVEGGSLIGIAKTVFGWIAGAAEDILSGAAAGGAAGRNAAAYSGY